MVYSIRASVDHQGADFSISPIEPNFQTKYTEARLSNNLLEDLWQSNLRIVHTWQRLALTHMLLQPFSLEEKHWKFLPCKISKGLCLGPILGNTLTLSRAIGKALFQVRLSPDKASLLQGMIHLEHWSISFVLWPSSSVISKLRQGLQKHPEWPWPQRQQHC